MDKFYIRKLILLAFYLLVLSDFDLKTTHGRTDQTTPMNPNQSTIELDTCGTEVRTLASLNKNLDLFIPLFTEKY